mmetsp:Transcript_53098/g.156935  ORF Transcript_53098/g.156935 Transcript_53098/m.156935 type:complete len:402 (+) Transcript_53098:230-1435(+)
MLPPLTLAVQAPDASVNGSSFQQQTPSAVVRSSGWMVSQPFFLSILVGASGGPSKPSNMTRSPGAAPAGGVTKPRHDLSALPAQSTMPCDSMPPILRVLRLAMMTTIAPWTSSSFICCARPERICRGFSSPRSMVSMYSLSESGCGWASTMRPTRMSAHEMSIGRSGSSAGAAAAAAGSTFFFTFSFFSVLNGLPSGPTGLPPSPAGGPFVPPSFLGDASSFLPPPLPVTPLAAGGGGGALMLPAIISASSMSIAASVAANGASLPLILASSGVASSAVSIEPRDGFVLMSSSLAKRGMTWKCAWKTSCPASLPLLVRMLTPGAPVAFCTACASLGSSESTEAATSAGMSVTETHGCFGSSSEWPGAMGKASRMAIACGVSKILKAGMSPLMIFAKMFSGS